jgi:hypothetical protein
MRQLILGIIGALWGGAIVISGLASGVSGGAYGGGQVAAIVFGFVFLLVGGRAIVKYARRSTAAPY